MSPEEALAYGLIDHVIAHATEVIDPPEHVETAGV
jgi:ATP-dependent protease ClpP protease subunit